jgi:immune inhibitor A
VRKVLFGAALLALLTIIAASPALASVSANRVDANDYLIARSLIRSGLIPPWASPNQVYNAVQAFIANGSGGAAARKMPLAPRSHSGARTALGGYLRAAAVDPSATQTYTSNTLVVLVEFGDDPWPSGDQTDHNTAGPVHGDIPAPASDDNSTFWPGDFSRAHYQDMLFGNSYVLYDQFGNYRGTSTDTMASYYLEQSHDAYTVSGDIAPWVQLDQPESWYGANDVGGDDLNGPVWRVARDAVAQLAVDDPTFDWAKYDQENPYGLNSANDYDFNEPDGYIDHLILVHAGVDESAGGGAEGADAIWAHSWWVFDSMTAGPGGNPGYAVPGSTGIGPGGHVWVGPYTINPEDGGIGVFCHEFGHDLGLPDEYDTTYGGESPSSFWTLMASGSWLGREFGLETKPTPMNVWDKGALGFISPMTVKRGKTATVTLQPAATGVANKVGVVIPLPKAKHSVPLSPPNGSQEWYSRFGNDLNNALTSSAKITIPSGSPTLSFQTWFEIETGYDWGYVEWSTTGVAGTWSTLRDTAGSSVATYDSGGGAYGLTGDGTTAWTAGPAVYDLSPCAGQSVYLRFRYYTDGGVAYRGWEVTGVHVNTTPIDDTAFKSSTWVQVDGTYKAQSTRYYIAEYRTYSGFDEALKNCYQFNYDYDAKVDWFPYNQGLHLIYRDTWYADNDVGNHPGEGGEMVLDARPMPDSVFLGGADRYWRTRIQVRDASFSKFATRSHLLYLTTGGAWGAQIIPGKKAQPWFDDSKTWWYPEAWDAGVKIQKLGVRIQVKSQTADAMKIWVDNKK